MASITVVVCLITWQSHMFTLNFYVVCCVCLLYSKRQTTPVNPFYIKESLISTRSFFFCISPSMDEFFFSKNFEKSSHLTLSKSIPGNIQAAKGWYNKFSRSIQQFTSHNVHNRDLRLVHLQMLRKSYILNCVLNVSCTQNK
uniref:Uncharacterized protein n=1 Tax=Oryza brachyantha TaxID=4533 RepID=J3L814_ORYBR